MVISGVFMQGKRQTNEKRTIYAWKFCNKQIQLVKMHPIFVMY